MSEEEKPIVLEEEEEKEEVEEQEEAVEETTEEAPVEEEEPEEEEVHYENAVNKGDFIMVEMTGTAETGEVFDTTSEETAQESGNYDAERTYGPRLVIVGDGYVLRGLDQRLPGISLEDEAEIEVPVEEAFGERNPANVQMIPFRILRSKGVNPVIGAELEIDGRPAIIRSIGSGRVQVDYNHRLAGRKIVYKVKVTEHITNDKKKMYALIGRRFLGIETSEFTLKKTKKKLRIGIPDQIFFGENIQIAKRGVAMDILRYYEDLEEVEFYETIKRS
ncbi:MAG: FKBP-type peptidyl-prolyl cis-trans isomerase [Candidatus Bathyarchaeota archaeon]|nr:FKBP-type peptidyl-prolyl cis-trans isomerase [Candidatus Bathyarchaeota archaeon]